MKEVTMALGEFVRGRVGVTILPATIVDVDEANATCTVKDPSGLEIYDVRLRAAVDGQESSIVVFPAVNAKVLIGNIGASPNAYTVLQVAEAAKVWVLAPTVELGIVNGEKAVLGETLNATLGDLKDTLQDLANHLNTFASTQQAASVGTLAPLAAGYATLIGNLVNITGQLSDFATALPDHLAENVTLS